MRMKNLMLAHVSNQCGLMFRSATDHVQEQLEEMCDQIRVELEANVQGLRERLTRDYLAVLVGADTSTAGLGPLRIELMLRGEMVPLLRKADRFFAELFPGQEGKYAKDEEDGADSDDDEKEEHDDGFVKEEPEPSTQGSTQGSIVVKGERE